jgi:hypothetical protein
MLILRARSVQADVDVVADNIVESLPARLTLAGRGFDRAVPAVRPVETRRR